MGLKINFNKTEYVCIAREILNLEIEHKIIKKCENFKYLGSIKLLEVAVT